MPNTAPIYNAIVADTGEVASTNLNPKTKAILNNGNGDYVNCERGG